MADKQIKKIRQAVLGNRGGLEMATDEQIMIIWSHLNPETQKEYLNSIERKDKNAVSTRTE